MRKITKLAVFDFDGTLCSTPLPDIGKSIFKEKTGKEFPHKGWWSKKESLDIDIFDIPMIDSVKEAYDKISLETDALKIMLTGRIKPLSKQVESILESHGLIFDKYYYNIGGSTEIYKMRIMDELFEKYPDADEIEIWEDREPHIQVFKTFLQEKIDSGRLKRFRITLVPVNRH